MIRSYRSSGDVEIPSGTIIYGTVRKRSSVGIGLIHERASLELSFDSYEAAGGERIPLAAKLVSIDNAREQVTKKGKIRGILAANNPGNLTNGFWLKPSLNLVSRSVMGLTGASNQVWETAAGGPIGIAVVFAIRCAIIPFPEPEIHLVPGTDMRLAVTFLRTSPDVEVKSNAPVEPALAEWVRARLDKVYRENGEAAPDLLNIVLRGTRGDLLQSFRNSGWALADAKSIKTSSRAYLAFSSMQAYASAPVSKLRYRGAAPDLVFEKSFNTIAQRHHIRLWNAGQFDGEEIWLGAATHDTGLAFKKSTFRFTHRIDPDIDDEREKVDTDLIFAGCAAESGAMDVSDLAPYKQPSEVATDRSVHFLSLQACSAPAQQFADSVDPGRPGTRATRLTRRLILEARNYLVRDNSYYWAYRLIASLRPH